MRRLILALAATLLLAACATTAPKAMKAPPTVSALDKTGQIVLAPNRMLSFTLGADGKPVFVAEAPHPPSDLRFESAGRRDQETWGQVVAGSFPEVKPGLVTFYLWADPRRGTMLVMTNGSEKGLVYVANVVMREEGGLVSTPTTICAVGPGRPGAEIWPYEVVAIEVKEIMTAPGPVCFDPDAKGFYQPGDQPPSFPKPLPPVTPGLKT